MSVFNYLSDAIFNGEIIEIVYHGGSKPGTVRTVIPVAFSADDQLIKCRYLDQRQIRSFKISKIQIPTGAEPNYNDN